jgi:uncharacterized protein YjbI with pentapeptide repeats
VATLYRTDFSGTILIRANLIGVYFWETDLRKADLSGADLRKADLSGANLEGAIISRNTDLREADLGGNSSYVKMVGNKDVLVPIKVAAKFLSET